MDDYLYNDLMGLCKNGNEIEALYTCLWYIDEHKDDYVHAIELRPHDSSEKRIALDNRISEAKNRQEVKDLILESNAVAPVRSTVQEIKDDITDYCEDTMRASGMGKKKWLKLAPLLTKYLNRPLTREEAIDLKVHIWKMDRIIKGLPVN